METLRWHDSQLILLDQTKLPGHETYISCTTWEDVRHAISILAVRGAPAIGVAAAYGVVLGAMSLSQLTDRREFLRRLDDICRQLDASRPTAVNLHWAVQRMLDQARRTLSDSSIAACIASLKHLADTMRQEDVAINRSLSQYGAAVMAEQGKKLNILTHCNAGALATAGIGTALGVIRALHRQGLVHRVYADETRPLLQGARLTVTELMADHIPVTLITDNMAAWVMKTKGVDAVIVGADRIARNGDTANKIGTYGLSVLAREHHIPFYVAAPISTFDVSLHTGGEIPIEERNPDEVRSFYGVQTALPEAPVCNPAFDVTPHEYITAIFTEKGAILHPDSAQIDRVFNQL